MIDFARLVPDARAFLAQLAEHNDRDWFAAHKSEFEERLKAPAEALLALLADELAAMAEAPVETKIYRLNRDLRFSKDKRPYNTHLHMLWRPQGAEAPAWLFGIAPDYVKAGWGWMAFSKPALEAWRGAMGDTDGAALADAISSTGLEPGEPDLKRVPAPWPQDHPRAEHLRRRGLILWADVEDATPATLMQVFARAEPARRALAPLL